MPGVSSVQAYNVWKYNVVALLAVADPVTRLTSLVVRATKDPFDAVLHFRSAAGLVVRAGAPGEVFVAVHSAEEARRWSVHAAFALTVRVGPVVELKPASKSAGTGAVSGVEPLLTWSRTTRPAVMETLPGKPQFLKRYDVIRDNIHMFPTRGGRFIPRVKLGQRVRKGDVLGTIKGYDGNVSETLTAPADGEVLVLWKAPLIGSGDESAVDLGLYEPFTKPWPREG